MPIWQPFTCTISLVNKKHQLVVTLFDHHVKHMVRGTLGLPLLRWSPTHAPCAGSREESSQVSQASLLVLPHHISPTASSPHSSHIIHHVRRTQGFAVRLRCCQPQGFLRLCCSGTILRRPTKQAESHCDCLLHITRPKDIPLTFNRLQQLTKVAVLGAGGGIGQPLSLLLKLNPRVSELSLYDIKGAPGVAADVSHINTKSVVSLSGCMDLGISD